MLEILGVSAALLPLRPTVQDKKEDRRKETSERWNRHSFTETACSQPLTVVIINDNDWYTMPIIPPIKMQVMCLYGKIYAPHA